MVTCVLISKAKGTAQRTFNLAAGGIGNTFTVTIDNGVLFVATESRLLAVAGPGR